MWSFIRLFEKVVIEPSELKLWCMSFYAPMVTEIVSCGLTNHTGRTHRWREHLHCFFQFDVMLSGQLMLDTDSNTLRYSAGDGIFIPALARHSHHTRKPFRVGMFKFHLAPRYWTVMGNSVFRVQLSRDAVRAAASAISACQRRAPLCEQQAGAAVTLCLVEALNAHKPARKAQANSGMRAQLSRMLEKVESDPYANWTVAGLAKECHLTPDHFGRCFKQALEQTPLEYLAKTRLRAAAHELASDAGKSIKDVADQSGYATVHAFTRAFRRVIGMNPGAFRRMPSEM